MDPRRLAVAAVLALVAALAPASSAGAQLRVDYSFPKGLAAGLADPNAAPPGANDWSCRPTAAHPRPVVLVHGTFENRAMNWRALSPLLKNNGYCVFALNYGDTGAGPLKALGPVASSARELDAFVDRVRAATGAAEVDIVGHSQGGMMPRQYLKFHGGAAEVHTLVGLAPSNHGTTLLGLALLADAFPGGRQLVGVACPSCRDQIRNSEFLQALNAGGDTVPGVRYVVIQTRYDEVVTPFTSAFLSGPNVQNILVQNGCEIDLVDHVAIPYDRRALTYVLNALDPANPRRVPCVPVAPLVGG